MTLLRQNRVMPDLIRHPASSSSARKDSGTPDHIRGDGAYEAGATNDMMSEPRN
jgi:hypothetical protein